jgi:Zn-dependent protease with chaperone function
MQIDLDDAGNIAPIARHFDGVSALPRDVGIVRDGARWRLAAPDGWSDRSFTPADLFAIEAAPPRRAFGHRDRQGWRLHFDGPIPDDLRGELPAQARYGRWIDRIGLWPAAALCAPVAAGLIALVLHAPVWIAPSIPLAWENRLGDAMATSFDQHRCHSPQGDAALAALAARLDPDRRIRSISVVNDRAENAVTLPGGHIMIFQGLLDQAGSPDEIAGVVGHEVGHVAHRDTMQALVRETGLGAVLGGFNGNVAGATNASLSLAYSRDAERAADDASIAAMKAANISPADTAAYFNRSASEENYGAAARWLSTHPQSADRNKRFVAAMDKDHAYAPALDEAQWKALAHICEDDPKMRQPEDYYDY